jgi:hypothetical protein
MELTAFGLLVIPVTCLLLPFHPRRLLVWTILLAPFEAASVLNLQMGAYEFGIQPGYVAAIAFLLALALRLGMANRVELPSGLPRVYMPLILFAGYAALSALLLPVVFAGRVSVFPPREGLTLSSLSLLEPAATNLSQAGYVVFLAAFAIGASLLVARDDRAGAFARTYVLTGMLVVALGVYQIMAHYVGLPYPERLLYSNPVYYQGFEQAIGTVKRMSSAFTEPSGLAYYLAGVFGYALVRCAQSERPLRPGVIALVALAGLLLSTSTTAYLTVAVILPVAAVILPGGGGRTRILAFAGIAAAAFGVLGWWLVTRAGSDVLAGLALITLVDKTGTTSFLHRIGADVHSLSLVPTTLGLGVGWGSNRASSLVTTLLSTGGIIGTTLLLWFAWRVASLVKVVKPGLPHTDRDRTAALGFSVIAMLVAGAIAVPDMNHIALWVNVALLIGLALRETPSIEGSVTGGHRVAAGSGV